MTGNKCAYVITVLGKAAGEAGREVLDLVLAADRVVTLGRAVTRLVTHVVHVHVVRSQINGAEPSK